MEAARRLGMRAPQALLPIVALVALSTAPATPAWAAPGPGLSAKVARVVDRGLRIGDRLVKQITADDSAKPLERGHGGPALQLGGLVGKGFFGAVYHLDAAAKESVLPGYEGQVVAKLPHGWRVSPVRAIRQWLTGKREPIAKASFISKQRLRAEIATRRFLDDNIGLAEASPLYPAQPAWKKGTVPVVPILEVLETPRGPAVLKPFVRGVSLGEIYARNGGTLSPDMERSLHEIYDFIQAMGDGVRVKRGLGFAGLTRASSGKGAPLALDGRPANLMWVEHPATLAGLGLSRPSFVFVELDQAVGNAGQYLAPRTSFEAYKGEVIASGREAHDEETPKLLPAAASQ